MNSMLHITLYHVFKKVILHWKYHRNVYSIFIIKHRMAEHFYKYISYSNCTSKHCYKNIIYDLWIRIYFLTIFIQWWLYSGFFGPVSHSSGSQSSWTWQFLNRKHLWRWSSLMKWVQKLHSVTKVHWWWQEKSSISSK